MKRALSIGISLLILAAIYWKIDIVEMMRTFRDSDPLWMPVSLGMVVPLTMLTAWRLQQLMPSREAGEPNPLSFAEANRLILAASSLNMVLPSKMGDIAKSYFMREKAQLSGSLSLSMVLFEKACDMLSLLLWCAFGLLVYPQKDVLFWAMTVGVAGGLGLGLLLLGSQSFALFFFRLGRSLLPKKFKPKFDTLIAAWQEMHGYFWRDRRQLLKITLTSTFIWFLHLLQIWMFILALKASVPFLANLALSPLALLAGLLPLTFAGVGTRDAAFILFYQSYFDDSTGAALGLLATARYFLPAIGGLPFLGKYFSEMQRLRQKPVEVKESA
ncbi:lysylphosphatidylglycerol synthase transmembrane domain-containing protein [Synechococcus sp. PCC 7336]|uniref:lysylphosphatidylglycerol synthase transmembrane domain-containing protein n=1 Tax=Synechococcus sp. PCC 7336 TaxID=195250 RepID=UPI00034C337C|nr:lysylphosphatidylglycerol synthase transmembrane domain-containing protein [Synechococcus sp. PCC 7336]